MNFFFQISKNFDRQKNNVLIHLFLIFCNYYYIVKEQKMNGSENFWEREIYYDLFIIITLCKTIPDRE